MPHISGARNKEGKNKILQLTDKRQKASNEKQ
jgi:hypothetical protein